MNTYLEQLYSAIREKTSLITEIGLKDKIWSERVLLGQNEDWYTL